MSCLISNPACLISNWVINLKNVNLFTFMWSKLQAKGPCRLGRHYGRAHGTLPSHFFRPKSREMQRQQGVAHRSLSVRYACVPWEERGKAGVGGAGCHGGKIQGMGWGQSWPWTQTGEGPRNKRSTRAAWSCQKDFVWGEGRECVSSSSFTLVSGSGDQLLHTFHEENTAPQKW